MYRSFCHNLESAFDSMKIAYKTITQDQQIIYQLTFPVSDPYTSAITMIVDDFFCVELSAFIARGITDDKRKDILEEINFVNDTFRFISLRMDENNDIYSCQQFILAGDEKIMCKQIVTNLLVFFDLHRHTAEKIHAIMCQ